VLGADGQGVMLRSCRDILGEAGIAPPDYASDEHETGTTVEGRFERSGALAPDVIVEREDGSGVAELDQSVTVLGSVGPYVFVHESTQSYSCGAHGGTGMRFVVWDLLKHAPAKWEESFAPGAEVEAVAREALARDPEAIMLWNDAEAPEIELTRVTPRWTLDGLALDAQFTTFACYACSDGAWSSYSRSTQVPLRGLPAALGPWADVPSAIAKLAAAHADVTMRGWSFVHEF
jgi:hypothetical protein